MFFLLHSPDDSALAFTSAQYGINPSANFLPRIIVSMELVRSVT